MFKFSFFQDPIGYIFGKPEIVTPNTSGGGNDIIKPLNLTTVAGYLIVGGLVFYFGKKLVK